MLRRAAQASMQEMTITVEGDSWTIVTSTTIKSMTKAFKLGVDFDEKTADMREVKTRGVFEAGKLVLVEKAKSAKQKSAHSTHELNGDSELIYKMWVEGREDLIAVLKFKRIE